MFAKLSAVETRPSQGDVAVLFEVDYKRPNGHSARLFLAVIGRNDIQDALSYAANKLRLNRVEYQPSLFFTWEWEGEFEKAVREFNLRKGR